MKKFAKWFAFNGVFMALVVAGACFGVAGAWACAVFAVWLLLILFLITVVGIELLDDKTFDQPIQRNVPRWLDIGYDILVSGVMVWTGHWFVALLYIATMFFQSIFLDAYNKRAKV